MMWIMPLGAAIVSGVFAGFTVQRWVSRKSPHNLAWSIALVMFSLASLSAALGMLNSWTPMLFRSYYLMGAIANVPVLALGTIYLLAGKRVGHVFALVVVAAVLFAAGSVFTADLNSNGLVTSGIPHAKDVLGEQVRRISRYFSITGFLVVVVGAIWSSWRLTRSATPDAQRLARANILIAVGTTVVAIGSEAARQLTGGPQAFIFSLGLLAGVSIMFAGFLKAKTRAGQTPESEQAS